MNEKNQLPSFEALRSAVPSEPLMSESDVLSALHRPSSYREHRSTRPFLLLGAAATIIGAVAFLGTRPTDVMETVRPVAHHVPTETYHAPAPQLIPPSTKPTSTRRRIVPTQPTSAQQQPRLVTNATSAPIAGVSFLDLTADEFAALPKELQPEIRTMRTRLPNKESRSLECLTASALSTSSVVDNGEDYVQMQAMYIPVRRVEHKAMGKVETVEWFKPTGDLISQLPERYRVPIMLEMNLLTEVQRGCITPSEACRSLPHAQSYFDMCRLDASHIKDLVVMPNPVRVSATCRVDLRYGTTLHLAAFTTSGAYVADLTETVTLDPGVHDLPIRVGGIAPGMYLITATTLDGEHVVRRIIIE